MPDLVVTSGAGASTSPHRSDRDPITTQVIRHGLISAAEQLKRALERTAFSQIIYETYDFAAALYDRQCRLLAQAESIALFMGTMNFCVEAAVEAVGGESALDDGDIIFYNWPYGTGSHQQDCAVVMPVFLPGGDLIGYAAIKAHFLDMGAKEPLCTDTTDVFQEGTIFPGVKMYRKGVLVEDIYRIALANSRLPRAVAGDINAEVVAVRTGAARLIELVERFGREVFEDAVETMFDHGERLVRHALEAIPDGRYVGRGMLDCDGVNDEPIHYDVIVVIEGSDITVDLSGVPDAAVGPVNSPLPNTVSAARIAVAFLAGSAQAPNEGYFRPLSITTRPGSLFQPEAPSPVFNSGPTAIELSDVILAAVAQAMPGAVPAGNCCFAGPVWWGKHPVTGAMWADGYVIPGGMGASERGDGTSGRMPPTLGRMRFSPVEVSEINNPWLVERLELAADSGGPGRHRGGSGVNLFVEALEDFRCTAPIERARRAPWGLLGGGGGRSNLFRAEYEDGTGEDFIRTTARPIPKGSTLRMMTGGGGGFGPAAERDPRAVHDDVLQGMTTEAFAREHYPHAFPD